MNPKQSKEERLRRNKIKGKAGEFEARVMFNLSGYEMERSPIGKDFIARRINPLNPDQVIETKNVEVKTGNAKLSKRQKETREKDGMDVYRTNAFPHNLF
jgi:hypothetical protein